MGRHPGALPGVPFAVVLRERVAHHRREPRLVDPGRVRHVVAEHGRDVLVAGEQVDVVDRVVEERRLVPEALPDGERVARERLVVEVGGVDRGAGAHPACLREVAGAPVRRCRSRSVGARASSVRAPLLRPSSSARRRCTRHFGSSGRAAHLRAGSGAARARAPGSGSARPRAGRPCRDAAAR